MPTKDHRSANNPMHAAGERGNIRQGILLVILLVTAVLGYLYFFTGVIKPREEVSNSPPRIEPVKQPLPPRPGQDGTEQSSPVTTPENAPAADGKEKPPQPANADKPAAPPVAPQARPAVVTSSKQTVAATPKPAASPAPKAAAVQVKAAKAAEKPASGVGTKTPSASLPPPAKSHKGSGARAAAVAPAKETKTPKPAAAGHQDAAKGRFTLLIGEFATDREAGKARLKLEKLELTPISARKTKKAVTMHRLFLAGFDNHDAAETELKKLRPHADGAFILRENGRYAVYAGSYLHEKGADRELKRLAGKGAKLVLKTAKVTLPMIELTAGSFPDSEKAQKEAGRLKKNGIAAKVLKMSK